MTQCWYPEAPLPKSEPNLVCHTQVLSRALEELGEMKLAKNNRLSGIWSAETPRSGILKLHN